MGGWELPPDPAPVSGTNTQPRTYETLLQVWMISPKLRALKMAIIYFFFFFFEKKVMSTVLHVLFMCTTHNPPPSRNRLWWMPRPFHVRRLVAPRRPPPTFSAPDRLCTRSPTVLPWQLSFFLLLHFNSRECPSLSRKLCNSLAKPLKKVKSSSRIIDGKGKKISRDSLDTASIRIRKSTRGDEILDLSIRARRTHDIYIYRYNVHTTSARNIKTIDCWLTSALSWASGWRVLRKRSWRGGCRAAWKPTRTRETKHTKGKKQKM